jgi:hypothetical protein
LYAYILKCENGEEFVILISDDINLEFVFEEIQASPPNQKSTSSLFDKEHVHDILNNLVILAL